MLCPRYGYFGGESYVVFYQLKVHWSIDTLLNWVDANFAWLQMRILCMHWSHVCTQEDFGKKPNHGWTLPCRSFILTLGHETSLVTLCSRLLIEQNLSPLCGWLWPQGIARHITVWCMQNSCMNFVVFYAYSNILGCYMIL
jgi:hypothetical protein